MLGRPSTFVFFNLAIYVPLLTIYGFELSPFITIFFALFVFVYNLRRAGFFSSLCLTILYLLIFDSEAYTFTAFNVRLWYFPLILLLTFHFLTLKSKIRKNSIPFLLIICVFLIFSIYYLIIETPEYKLHIIKYWVFSVGLIYLLIIFFKKHLHPALIIEYLFSLTVFVTVYGFIQYIYNLKGWYNLENTPGNVRPEAFFSETTWYAEYIVLGFIYAALMRSLTGKRVYLVFYFFFLTGLYISNTRNAFLGLLLIILFESFFFILKAKVRISFTKNTYLATALTLFVGGLIFFVNSERIKQQTVEIIKRFDVKTDESGQGRIEAFNASLKLIKQTPFFGNGFYWNPEKEKAGAGNTALGAKSFNLLFMVYHIFGPFGFIFFSAMIILYFYLLLSLVCQSPTIFARSAFYIFFIFFVMAMFAPIHQFPIGMQFVALSVFLFNCGLNEKTLLYNS